MHDRTASWQKIANITEFCKNLTSIDNCYIFMITLIKLIKFLSHRENIV